mgnify:CR=1 FL=1
MRTKIDPDSIGFLINDMARLSRAIFASEIETAALPVTAAEARVLAHMARTGASRQHLLAESLGMTPMSLTGFLDKLEKEKLIQRQPDPDDRRAKIVTLTDRAAEILADIAQAGARAEQKISEGLSPEDWDSFRRIALLLRNNLSPNIAGKPKSVEPV